MENVNKKNQKTKTINSSVRCEHIAAYLLFFA